MRRLVAAVLLAATVLVASARPAPSRVYVPLLATTGTARTVQPLERDTLTAGTFVYRGVTRTYVLHSPPYGAEIDTLLVVLHGSYGSGKSMARLTGFDAIADANGFAVLYPDGLNGQWNYNNATTGPDDLGYLFALVQSFGRPHNDMVGYSAGAGMATDYVVTYPSHMQGLATVAGGLTESMPAPRIATAVISFHGTADSVWNYDGIGKLIATPTVAQDWAATNGCAIDSGIVQLPNISTTDGSTPEVETYSGCARTSVLYTLVGGGHTWPGTAHPLPGLGSTDLDISASQLIWQFFTQGVS